MRQCQTVGGTVPDPEAVSPQELEAESTPAQLTAFRALRHRNYRLYFFGQLVSLICGFILLTRLNLIAAEQARREALES